MGKRHASNFIMYNSAMLTSKGRPDSSNLDKSLVVNSFFKNKEPQQVTRNREGANTALKVEVTSNLTKINAAAKFDKNCLRKSCGQSPVP